jgi:DNA-binding PadR family transcriptional regulator
MMKLTPDATLLGLLAEHPQHGYQLLLHFRDPAQLGEVWNLSTSQLYAVLKRLNEQGLIEGTVFESPEAPPRTEYSITSAGMDRLLAWLGEPEPPASIRAIRVEFLSRLYVARLLNHPIRPIMDRQRDTVQRKLALLRAEREHSPSGVGLLSLELVIGQLEHILGWIERCAIMGSSGDRQL